MPDIGYQADVRYFVCRAAAKMTRGRILIVDAPFPLSGPSSTPKNVNGAVRAPFLDGQRGVVPETRALSHYSGDAF
jgi:hypothetical protein